MWDGIIRPMESKKRLLNLYECAEQLQVTPKWLKATAIKGDVPCLRIGKQIMRFELQAVIEAVALLAAQSSYSEGVVSHVG
jgi:hypothetical protein